MILESSVDRLWHMIMSFKIERHHILGDHLSGNPAYSFDCTFFRPISLTAKDIHRMVASDSCPLATYTPSMEITMGGFLVDATEPEKRTLNMPFFVNDSRCKRVQQRILG